MRHPFPFLDTGLDALEASSLGSGPSGNFPIPISYIGHFLAEAEVASVSKSHACCFACLVMDLHLCHLDQWGLRAPNDYLLPLDIGAFRYRSCYLRPEGTFEPSGAGVANWQIFSGSRFQKLNRQVQILSICKHNGICNRTQEKCQSHKTPHL